MTLLRYNLSLAMVGMVRDTEQRFVGSGDNYSGDYVSGDYATLSGDTCYAPENLTGPSVNPDDVRYDWSTVEQGQS